MRKGTKNSKGGQGVYLHVRQVAHLARRGRNVQNRLLPPPIAHAIKNQGDRRPLVGHVTRDDTVLRSRVTHLLISRFPLRSLSLAL